MSSASFMQLYVGDYLADTQHLSAEEHGAYLLLLMSMWTHGGSLPADPAKLARVAKVTPRKWPAVWETIGPFFDVEGDRIVNKRLLIEREKVSAKSQVRSDAGRRGGLAKARKDKEARLANATVLPEPLPQHLPDTIKSRELRSLNKGDDVLMVFSGITSDAVAKDFIAHRAGLKAKLTVRAAELIARKLAPLGIAAADAALLRSIESGWRGVFPEQARNGGSTNGQRRSNLSQALDIAMERARAFDEAMADGAGDDAALPLLPARH